VSLISDATLEIQSKSIAFREKERERERERNFPTLIANKIKHFVFLLFQISRHFTGE